MDDIVAVLDSVVRMPEYRWLFSALKGLRNGIVYGIQIRAPHALVMQMLFGRGDLLQRLVQIFKLTRIHATNLGKFALGYKLGTNILAELQKGPQQWHSLIVAAVAGYMVFGQYNAVNMQINLYLLSRIVLGLYRLGTREGYLPRPPKHLHVFPLFAALVWGVVLWLFEHHPNVLQASLRKSMVYIYHDSNKWTQFRDWFWVNVL